MYDNLLKPCIFCGNSLKRSRHLPYPDEPTISITVLFDTTQWIPWHHYTLGASFPLCCKRLGKGWVTFTICTYTVAILCKVSSIHISVTWRWPTVAETCRRQHNIKDTRQLCCDVPHPLPNPWYSLFYHKVRHCQVQNPVIKSAEGQIPSHLKPPLSKHHIPKLQTYK